VFIRKEKKSTITGKHKEKYPNTRILLRAFLNKDGAYGLDSFGSRKGLVNVWGTWHHINLQIFFIS
jgi:hypothetical protein